MRDKNWVPSKCKRREKRECAYVCAYVCAFVCAYVRAYVRAYVCMRRAELAVRSAPRMHACVPLLLWWCRKQQISGAFADCLWGGSPGCSTNGGFPHTHTHTHTHTTHTLNVLQTAHGSLLFDERFHKPFESSSFDSNGQESSKSKKKDSGKATRVLKSANGVCVCVLLNEDRDRETERQRDRGTETE